MVDLVLRHAPDFRPETVEMRVSRSGNYLSVTCVVRATPRRSSTRCIARSRRIRG